MATGVATLEEKIASASCLHLACTRRRFFCTNVSAASSLSVISPAIPRLLDLNPVLIPRDQFHNPRPCHADIADVRILPCLFVFRERGGELLVGGQHGSGSVL